MFRWRQYKRVELRHRQMWQNFWILQRLATASSSRARSVCIVQHLCTEKPLMTLIDDDRILENLDWMLLHLITLTFRLRGMANKKFKFKVFGRSQQWIGSGNGRTERRHCVHGPIRLRYVGDVGFWSMQSHVSKRTSRDCAAERCCQYKANQDNSEKHAQVFAWQLGSL